MTALQNWLREFGLEPLTKVLADNDIDLEIISDLTETDSEGAASEAFPYRVAVASR